MLFRCVLPVLFGLLASPGALQASVSLERTLQSGDGSTFEDVSAMVSGTEGTLVVIDRELGLMIEYKGAAGARYALSGSGRAFDSDEVSGIARTGGNRYVITNARDDSVVLVDADGSPVKTLATGGSEQGQLSEPASVAWSSNRRMYVADRGNDRISVFGLDGVFIRSIGQAGVPEDSRLEEPACVAVDAMERIYVLEKRDGGILSVYSHDGTLLKRLDAGRIRQIVKSEPELEAMTIDDAGLVYLADNDNGRIYRVDWQNDRLVTSFGSRGTQRGQFEDITSLLSLPGDRLAVADRSNRKIEIYRLPASGAEPVAGLRLPTVGYERSIDLECSRAYRIRGGNVLCLDEGEDRVGTFTASGRPVVRFRGDFSRPTAASVEDQKVVILDGETIKIYRLDGGLRYTVGASGDADGQLDSPQGVYIRGSRIYVADTGNRRVQIFSNDGIYLDKIVNPQHGEPYFREPVRVVADSSENLFVLDAEAKQVLVFSPQHRLLYRIGGEERGPNAYEKIHDISIDSDDNLYILAAVPGNEATIHVYSGPVKTIGFGAVSEQRTGMQEPVSLSIPPANKTIVSVYDEEKNSVLNYKYMQLPAPLGGLAVLGSTRQTRLEWQPVPGSYISRYMVYGAREQDGPFKYVTDVGGTEAVIEHNTDFTDKYYRVSAVSGFSVEGEPSNIREDAFQLGYDHYRNGRYSRAAEIFREAYTNHPDHGEIIKYLGLAAMKLGRAEDAVAYFRQLAQLDGYRVEAQNLQIRAQVAVQDYVAARAIIDRLIAADEASTETLVYCGELSLLLGDAIGAVTCLEQALARDEGSISAHFLMGKAYIRLGIIDDGLKEFETAVSLDPDNAEVWYQGGVVFAGMERHEEAIERFNRSLALDADNPDARLALARSHLALEQYDQVRNIAIRLAGGKDTASEGQYLLGLAALADKQYGQALLALTKSTRTDPHNANAWLALADTFIKMNQPEKVRDALASAVEGDDTSFEAARRLGEYDYRDGKYQQAADSLAIAAGLKPDRFEVRYMLADARLRSGAYNMAAANAAEAARLQPDNIDTMVLQADIANRQGKVGKAIDHVRQAMEKQPDSARLHTKLGGFYVENNLFDQARATLEKAVLLDKTAAEPHRLLGSMYLSRRLFDEAIREYDAAVRLDPGRHNRLALDAAYAEKKKSMEFKSNAPQIVLSDLRLERVFSAAYKQYADRPVGRVRVHNTSAQDYGNLRLTFAIKGYMDFPATTEITMLRANESLEFPLHASFNNRILEIDEDTGVQAEVAVNFIRDGRKDSIRVTHPMTIYGKNAIAWGEPSMVGAFVTPKDDALRDFVRTAINENKPEAEAVDGTLLTAMTLFDVFGAHGIRYVVDPNNPYTEVGENAVDYVQFGRETLKLKSGDCDDLSVLMSAGLENLGIETAIVDVPGHLLMMFNTGLPETERERISMDDELLVFRDGEIWIPVEATMVGTSFAEAWAEGARKYHRYSKQGEIGVVPLREAWNDYRPVTLQPAAYTLAVPDPAHVSPLVTREKDLLLEKSLERLVKPYRAMAEMTPDNIKARMQVAIIYARYGLYDAANREFDEIQKISPNYSAVQNNRGNIYFTTGDYERAIENYRYAEKLASNDPGIKMNLSMAYYKLGDLGMAGTKYEEASMIDSEIGEQYAGYVKLLSK